MTITTKFDVGQQVWYVDKAWKPVPCPACDKTGTVVLNGSTYVCPSCKGDKYIEDETELHEPIRGAIDLIQIDDDGIHYQVGVLDWLDDDQLYATEAEAQAEADRRNSQ